MSNLEQAARDFGREIVQRAVAMHGLRFELDAAKCEIERLRAALKFYASGSSDGGRTAVDALYGIDPQPGD